MGLDEEDDDVEEEGEDRRLINVGENWTLSAQARSSAVKANDRSRTHLYRCSLLWGRDDLLSWSF